ETLADDFFAPFAGHLQHHAIHDRDAILGVDGVDDLRQRVHDGADEQALRFELELGLAAFAALACFEQRTIYDGRQALQPIFQDVIGRAALERFDRAFFAERARYEDERHARARLLRNLERGEPVE